MQTSAYLYAHHEPEERLEVEALTSVAADGWVHVHPPDPNRNSFSLGLTPEQARDLARNLFRAAGEVEAVAAEATAQQPQAAPA